MGNWWGGRQSSPRETAHYEVVLPTTCRSWELLYSGDIDTWEAVAGRYGMDKYAYRCGLTRCDREAVCLRYLKASLSSDSKTIIIERYKAPTVHIPVSKCTKVKALLADKYLLNEVAVTRNKNLVLLVLRRETDFRSMAAFVLVNVGEEGDGAKEGKKEAEKAHHHPFKRLSFRKEPKGEGKAEMTKRSASAEDCKKLQQAKAGRKNACGERKESGQGTTGREKVKPQCLGVFQSPHRNMTIISCQISPDLSQTAVLFYSVSSTTRTFCYMLYFYSNSSLKEESCSQDRQQKQQEQAVTMTPTGSSEKDSAAAAGETEESNCPHLLHSIKLSREVQPYFVYDPRYGSSRIAVANYECKDLGIAHELVVLNLQGFDGKEDVKLVKRGKLSLPALFGNSRFNLLYSKDGDLIILQKLTDDRFGVTSFCDIYIFLADNLTLTKYMTASLPGLFHICKVSYEPVFSRCGGFMRVVDHRLPNNDPAENDDYMVVQIYQLPRSLSLLSQCRRAILQQVQEEQWLDMLPLPLKFIDYLKFEPMY